MNFGIYDDSKPTLTGIIDNLDFAILTKKLFIRILAMKFRQLYQINPGLKFYRIFKTELTQKEQDTVSKYFDRNFK